jgi:hypothetical protein
MLSRSLNKLIRVLKSFAFVVALGDPIAIIAFAMHRVRPDIPVAKSTRKCKLGAAFSVMCNVVIVCDQELANLFGATTARTGANVIANTQFNYKFSMDHCKITIPRLVTYPIGVFVASALGLL